MPNYADMTLKELEKLNQDFGNKRKELLAKQRELRPFIEEKIADERARKALAAMSDSERAAVQKIAGAGGIGSMENVGTPGK